MQHIFHIIRNIFILLNLQCIALKELNHVVNAFKRNQLVFDIGTQILHQLFDYFVTLPV